MSREDITNGKKDTTESTVHVSLPKEGGVLANSEPNDTNELTAKSEYVHVQLPKRSPEDAVNTPPPDNDSSPSNELLPENHLETETGQNIAFDDVESARMNVGERFIARLQMNYHRGRGERHERKAAERHGNVQNIDASIRSFEQARHTLEESIGALQQNGLPGEAQIRMKMDIIDKQIETLSNKRDREQTKFESQDNKRKLFYNERDRIADTLIDHYEEKMQPMESTLEMIYSKRNQLDLDIAVMETYHREQETRLADIEQRAKQLQNTLAQAGMSYRDVQAMIRPLATQVQNGRRAMQLEKRQVLQHRDMLQQQIARVDRKVNPYRDKRDQLARIKQDRLINMTIEARDEVPRDTEQETIQGHTRYPRHESNTINDEPGIEGDEGDQEPQPTIEDDMHEWLTYRNEQAKKRKEQPLTNAEMRHIIDTFFRKTRYTRERDALGPSDFKKVLIQFYKSERAPGTPEARSAERGIDPIAKEFDAFQKARAAKNNEK